MSTSATSAQLENNLARAAELSDALEEEYKAQFEADPVNTARAEQLVHEVADKLSRTLDQAMHLAWEKRILPLSPAPGKGKGYFPIFGMRSFEQQLTEWVGAKNPPLSDTDPDLDFFLRTERPGASAIRRVSNAAHTRLLPQAKYVSGGVAAPGFILSIHPQQWGLKRYQEGASPTIKFEQMVLLIEGENIDALWWCRHSVDLTGIIVNGLVHGFDLD